MYIYIIYIPYTNIDEYLLITWFRTLLSGQKKNGQRNTQVVPLVKNALKWSVAYLG